MCAFRRRQNFMRNNFWYKLSLQLMSAVFALLILSSLDTFAQTLDKSATPVVPADFTSDGCTHFPDGNYLDCCVEHDRAYFVGGSWTQRWRADKKLYQCVAAKDKFYNKSVAVIMWLGVRAFGVPWLKTKASWGFGRREKLRIKN